VVNSTITTYGFLSTVTSNTRNYRNNIFFNARSNTTGTGKHYGIGVGGSGTNPTGLTTNNNVVLANGTTGTFGRYNGADVANITAWRTATGQDANSIETDPSYNDPTNATPNLHLLTGSPARDI